MIDCYNCFRRNRWLRLQCRRVNLRGGWVHNAEKGRQAPALQTVQQETDGGPIEIGVVFERLWVIRNEEETLEKPYPWRR